MIYLFMWKPYRLSYFAFSFHLPPSLFRRLLILFSHLTPPPHRRKTRDWKSNTMGGDHEKSKKEGEIEKTKGESRKILPLVRFA